MRDIQIAEVQLFQTFLEVSLPHLLQLVDHTNKSSLQKQPATCSPCSEARAEERAVLGPGEAGHTREELLCSKGLGHAEAVCLPTAPFTALTHLLGLCDKLA